MSYPTDVLIVLYVDVASIIQYDNSQTTEVLKYVYLADNQGDLDPADKTKFTTKLSGNSQIAWFGAVFFRMADGLTGYVHINDITNITGNIPIEIRPKSNGSGNTHVDALIPKNSVIPSNAVLEYTINFSVFVGGKKYVYSIDPKLSMH